ncbi:unnamed protein product [Cylindrotheca closterium]|uniref:Thioredoxin domain-containing protein n=1 Tax=Cylindrotheca closterium TaxID=2856 RepID=A0AAD2G400_9STRA|nr:unnamed protein product [Cylindrotheca closterium]
MYHRLALTFLAASYCCIFQTSVSALGYGANQQSYSVETKTTTVRRERNLDHWDSDTLAYYLDDYRGHDVAIMFYAQWDHNSHALAPYWDRIATILDAGNTGSRLVMALFDCEMNNAHIELCKALNVDAYPTLMFVGSGPYHDTDPITKKIFGKNRSAGRMGEAPVSNTVKFQGNWKYGDAIMDWIRTMQALSNWHLWTTQGFGKRLRNFLLPHKTPNNPLPVGVPNAAAGGGGSSAGGGAQASGVDSAKTKALEQQVEALAKNSEQLEKLAVRGDAFLDVMLNPVKSSTLEKDPYVVMKEHNVWANVKDDDKTEDLILFTCVVQTSLDYCQRVSKDVAFDLVTKLEAQGQTIEEMLASPTLEQDILSGVAELEPFCGLMDECLISNFEDEKCRPDTCPFTNPNACRYLTACFNPEIQSDYAEAVSEVQGKKAASAKAATAAI